MKLKALLEITEDLTHITLIRCKTFHKYEPFYWGYVINAKGEKDIQNLIVLKQEPIENGLSIWIIN